MQEVMSTPAAPSVSSSRFGLAPPRRFVLPAILLLLSERPSYGYNLQKDLQQFRFGHIDRPTTYRALAQLEHDGLVESWTEAPKAGQARRVYGITPVGDQVLRMWMSIVKEERDCLGRVLDRYQATGIPAERLDADVAWRMALGFQRPPVMPLPPVRRLVPIDGLRRSRIDRSVVARDAPPEHGEVATVPAPSTSAGVGARRRFRIVPDRSVLLVEIRSSVGPVNFGALGLTGAIDADLIDGNIRTATSPAAHVEIAMDGLRSGNRFYDAELLRRIDARRYPTATLTMSECVESGAGHRYRLAGDLTFHGVVRPLTGTVRVEVTADERLLVTGEEVFDIRDFGIPSPVVLMLRFYPDVKVHLHVEAELEET